MPGDPSLEYKITQIEKAIEELRRMPTQSMLTLELENMSNKIKLDVTNAIANAMVSMEKKIEDNISAVIKNQKEKISWGMELLRFAIVAIMFILSIQLINLGR